MPKQTCLKVQYQLRALLEVHLHSKIQENSMNYSYEIAGLLSHVLWTCPGMPNHNHQKGWYHLVENIDVYLDAKNQSHTQLPSQGIWLPEAFWSITQELEICLTWGLSRNINSNMTFHFRLFFEKFEEKNFQKCKKYHFGPFSPRTGPTKIFWENWSPLVFSSHEVLHSYKNSEKN